MTQSTDQRFDIAAALKGQQWERCKGELRAFVLLQGSYHSASLAGEKPSSLEVRMRRAKDMVEAFIVEMEDQGLHE